MIHCDLPVQGILTKESRNSHLGQIEWNNYNFDMIDIDRRVLAIVLILYRLRKVVLTNNHLP